MDAKDKVVQLIETAKSCGLKMKLRSMKALEAPEEPVVLSPERYRKYKITALIVVIVGAVLLIAFVFAKYCFRACIIYDYARTGRTASTAIRTVKR